MTPDSLVADAPVMPGPEIKPTKRGRPLKTEGSVPIQRKSKDEMRLETTTINGRALAPYAVAILETVEVVYGLHGVDAAKREQAAIAIGVAVAYSPPAIDPMTLVWGGAAAAVFVAYREPFAMSRKIAKTLDKMPAPAVAAVAA
jgi:hypothetical protein